MTLDDVVPAAPDTFDRLVAGPDLVISYFWGPDCPNCEVFARDLPGLLAQLPSGVRVVKVDAYQFPALATRFGLFGIPAFILFKDGLKLGMMRQYHGREYWRRVVAEQAGLAPEA
jgi:thiol-disulfide isomerase/thioredoxin